MPKNKGGRPPFSPTPALRKRVSVGAAGGMTHEELALALGITRPTLEKHFELELSVGAHQRRLDVLNAMYSAATGRKKNVAAQKAFMAESPAIAAPPQPDGDKTKPEKLGKKEQQEQDATTAHIGTEWADLLKPSSRPQ